MNKGAGDGAVMLDGGYTRIIIMASNVNGPLLTALPKPAFILLSFEPPSQSSAAELPPAFG